MDIECNIGWNIRWEKWNIGWNIKWKEWNMGCTYISYIKLKLGHCQGVLKFNKI